MLCQNCQNREAVVQLTKIVNGQANQMQLCQDCAQKVQGIGFSLYPGMVTDFLQALLGMNQIGQPETPISTNQQERCQGCGITFEQIQKAGRLGCSNCYEKFERQMELLLRRIHGGGSHVGKVPLRSGEVFRSKKELASLKNTLKELIQKEEFEQAAIVRDKIRLLEKNAGGEEQ